LATTYTCGANPIGNFGKGAVKRMSYLAEKRKYQRCDNLVCKALISTDEKRWENMELCDISAGGLQFTTKHNLHEGMKLYFNLYVYNMLSEFNIKLEGCVVRVDRSKCGDIYAVRYENLNKYHQVQLDELVKSKMTVKNTHEHEFVLKEDEYSILLLPRLRPRSRRLRVSNYK
jgi:hypothetical protein